MDTGFGPGTSAAARIGPDPAELERLKGRRDAARWNAVMGFGLMFGAGFHAGFAIGGAAMTLYGVSAAFYWGRRLRKLKGDPWAYDPELDGPDSIELQR
jgi:hypothetical protein